MSRTESKDTFDIPPGLGFLPRPGTNIHNYHQSSVTPLGEFPPIDRRGSLSMGYSSFSPPHLSISRSIGVHDQEYGIFGNGDNWPATPNRHTPTIASSQVQQLLPSNLQHRSPPPLNGASASVGNNLSTSSSYNDRENYFFRSATNPSPPSSQALSAPAAPATSPSSNTLRSTIYWSDLEPWMDEEYAKRVCRLMNWDPTNIKIPPAQPDPVTGQQSNNPGYCFLTFSSQAQAERVMNQVNPMGGGPTTMPNSNRPFNIKFAASLPSLPPISSSPGNLVPGAQQQYPREYSIFVGDLAPETSNSDLVAVFRNPVLGLRNDREPKFIRPFLSCKSAKIMLDPVTGVSRGYGFVRFTDEADQQRALIEMHGLYCLSRPMRISPATAKFKPPTTVPAVDLLHVQIPSSTNGQEQSQSVTIALPLPNGGSKSISAPIAVNNSSSSFNPVSSAGSGSSLAASNSVPSLSSGSTASISSSLASASSGELFSSTTPNVLAQLAQFTNGSGNTKDFAQDLQQQNSGNGQKYEVSEESWKHHAQARAILGNLIGPNGEQLTSTDPYNTTVFVGGLSPLIGEDTLRSFFTPFGEIHYVKVPVGKHCGFVQFVRKADAERAIENMQGFPIGGSRIRLSWGRSQYKAAQAAAQAAQAAQSNALQAQLQLQVPSAPTTQLTSEEAIQLIQRLALAGVLDSQGNIIRDVRSNDNSTNNSFGEGATSGYEREEKSRFMSGMMDLRQNRLQKESKFSPFSPDPNLFSGEKNESSHQAAKNYTSTFAPSHLHMLDSKAVAGYNSSNEKIVRLSNASQRFGSLYLDDPGRRQEAPISRPNSGTPSNGKTSHQEDKEQEAIQDVNGTLANLDLDSQLTWKPLSADSFAQYRPTPSAHGSTPSP